MSCKLGSQSQVAKAIRIESRRVSGQSFSRHGELIPGIAKRNSYCWPWEQERCSSQQFVISSVPGCCFKSQRDFSHRKKFLRNAVFLASFPFVYLSSNISQMPVCWGLCWGQRQIQCVSWTQSRALWELTMGNGDIKSNYPNPACLWGQGGWCKGRWQHRKGWLTHPVGWSQGRTWLWSWVSQERCYGLNCAPPEFILKS